MPENHICLANLNTILLDLSKLSDLTLFPLGEEPLKEMIVKMNEGRKKQEPRSIAFAVVVVIIVLSMTASVTLKK